MCLSGSDAALLVYEPFDYPINLEDAVEGALNGKEGAIGFSGPWEDMTSGSNAGIPFLFDSAGNTEETNGIKPDWDGVFDNLEQVGGYVGLSPFSNDVQEDRINARRPLAQSAGEMAGADGVLWMSMVVHFEDSRFVFAPALALSDGGGFQERVTNLSDSSNGLGFGNGGPPINDGRNATDITVSHYVEGIRDEATKVDVMNLDTAIADYLIVCKYEFGEASDSLAIAVFDESAEISEAAFDANTVEVSATVDIDEDTLTTLAVGVTRAGNAYDEIKIGDTFGDVTGDAAAAAGPIVLEIFPSVATPGAFDFSWSPNEGKVYDLVSDTDLFLDPATWAVWQAQSDLATGLTTGVPAGAEGTRFFALIEKNAPTGP